MPLFNFEFNEKLAYTIDELSRRWKCKPELITEYLVRSKLHAAVILPESQFSNYNDLESSYILYLRDRIDDPFGKNANFFLNEEGIIAEAKKLSETVWLSRKSSRALYIIEQKDVKALFDNKTSHATITLDSVNPQYRYLYDTESFFGDGEERNFQDGNKPTISYDDIYILKGEADNFEIKYDIDVSEDNSSRQIIFEQEYVSDNKEQLAASRNTEHGNTKIFSAKREEILGAAMTILSKWPDQCKNSSGKIQATKLRTLIEEKALLFWPETGSPPLKTEPIEKLLRSWLKKI